MVRDKVAIITGSTSGIGEAAAALFAQNGAYVVITGRDMQRGKKVAEHINRSGSGKALFLPADLLDPEAPQRLVEQTVEQWGRIDIVVNNAAMVCNKPVEQINHEDWDRLFTVNLKAPFFLIQTAIPYLRQSKGCVINISSMGGVKNDVNNLVYDTIKAGLNHMTTGLALDFRSEGIRFNAVMPGGVATPLLDQWFEQITKDTATARELAGEAMASPGTANPYQIADAVLLLAGGFASWINGAVIPLDGGYSLGYS